MSAATDTELDKEMEQERTAIEKQLPELYQKLEAALRIAHHGAALAVSRTYEEEALRADSALHQLREHIDTLMRHRDHAQLRLSRDAGRLADEVAVLVRRKVIDSRSPAADALLDFREPPSTPRADRMAVLEEELKEIRRTLDVAEVEAFSADDEMPPGAELPLVERIRRGLTMPQRLWSHYEALQHALNRSYFGAPFNQPGYEQEAQQLRQRAYDVLEAVFHPGARKPTSIVKQAWEKVQEERRLVGEVFDSLRTTIVSHPGDQSEDRRMAWLFAILVGWDQLLAEVAKKHGWSEQAQEKLQRFNKLVKKLLPEEPVA